MSRVNRDVREKPAIVNPQARKRNASKPYWIKIRWGQSQPKCTTTRRFASIDEFNAYLLGVEDTDGWLSYEVLDRNDWQDEAAK